MMKKPPEGNLIDFNTVQEGWTLVKLEDGNYLRVKLVITKVIKTKQINTDGTPVYAFQALNAFTVLTVAEVQKLYKPDGLSGE